MTSSFMSPPNSARFVLSHATLPDIAVSGYEGAAAEGLVKADLVIEDGLIAAVLPPGSAPQELSLIHI